GDVGPFEINAKLEVGLRILTPLSGGKNLVIAAEQRENPAASHCPEFRSAIAFSPDIALQSRMAAEIARPIRLSVATPHEPSWAIVTTVQSSFPSWCSAAFKGIGPASRAASTATIGYLRSLPMAGSYRLRHAPQSSVSVVMRLRQDAMR